jgi:hypothetical protein
VPTKLWMYVFRSWAVPTRKTTREQGTPTREPNVMRIRKRACRGAAHLGLLLAAVATVLAAPVAANASSSPTPGNTAAPTAAISFPPVLAPVSPITPGDPAYNEVRHKCVVVGHAGTAQAVHCADVFTQNAAIGGIDVFVENEVFCQRTAAPNVGSLIACSGVKEQLAVGSPFGTASIPAQICGGILGHSPCTSGRDLHAGFTFNYLPGGSTVCSIWGESVRDSIVLPVTGHPTVSATVVATNPFNALTSTPRQGYCPTP